MGAYENPPMIQFATSSAGDAWAKAAADAGKNFGNAIIARRKKLEERLKKENETMLKVGKQRSALAQEGQKQLESQLSKMEGLDDAIKNAYVEKFRSGWKTYTEVQVATDPSQIDALQPKLKEFENFRANGVDSVTNANELYIGLTGSLDEVAQKEIAIPGAIDQFDSRNNYLMEASAIENGGITGKEKREVSFNKNGDTIITYTNAEGVKLNPINLTNPPVVNKVPKLDELFQPKVDATGIFVGEGKDRTLSTDYLPTDDTGKPEMKTTTETFVDENGNKKQKIITGPAVNNNDIIETYTTQIEALGLTDDQKVSIYKNILVDQYKLDSEALSYNPNGATELTPAQQKTFDEAIAMWAGTKANNDVAAVTKKMGGSEKIVNVPKEELSNSLKNTRFEFTKLIKGEQETLAISNSTYFAKDESGNWNVFTVGSQLGVPKARYENGKANVIDLVADLPASFNIDKEALIKQLQLVN